jgi:hypothetical protein
MLVTVTGASNKLAEQLTEAARFYASVLLNPRTVKNITLDIEVSSGLEDLGYCCNEDGTKNPRWFTISLRRQELLEMEKTLAHEMVHLKQHAKNELRDITKIPAKGKIKKETLWMGVPWEPKKGEDPIYDSPWEVESYGKEVGLIHRYYKYKELI